jgi:probable F420-dependent oxidoreductase
MKVGLIPVNMGVQNVDDMIAIARKAEEVGIESVWTFEHVMVPVDYESKYPYSPNGKMGAPPETPIVDPLIALASIAANTERLRLATGVNILPQRNPLYLAKQAASLDFVSKGRFMLGIGIGWLKEEFDALDAPFERRGARFDDYVSAMKKVWSGDVVEHQSDFVSWSGFKSFPLPVQKPHLPLVIGGTKGKAFERIARDGDGWYAPTAAAAELEPLLPRLQSACEAVGRDPSTVEVSSMWPAAVTGLDGAKAFADLGVSRLIVPLFAMGGGNPIEALDKFGGEMLSKLA